MSLADFLDEYARGASTLYKLEERLRFDARREAYDQTRRDARLLPRLLEQAGGRARSPEEIILERERCGEVFALCEAVRSFLGAADFALFCLLALEGRRQQTAAAHLGVSQQAVSKRYRGICLRLRAHFGAQAEALLVSVAQEALRPQPTSYGAAGIAFKQRCPSDILSARGAAAREADCRAAAYLDEAYGDEKTCCSYCDRCRDARMRRRCTQAFAKKRAAAVVKATEKSVSI